MYYYDTALFTLDYAITYGYCVNITDGHKLTLNGHTTTNKARVHSIILRLCVYMCI